MQGQRGRASVHQQPIETQTTWSSCSGRERSESDVQQCETCSLTVTSVNIPKRASIATILVLLLAPLGSWAQAQDSAALVVEDLQCRGNTTTSCQFILSYLYVERGEVLDETEVRNAQLRLSTLHMFDSVNIFLERGSQRGQTIVVVEVVETNPIGTEWLAGASYRIGALRAVAAGRVTDDNLFGNGKFADLTATLVQSLNGTHQEGHAAAFRYVDPHLLDSQRYFGVVRANYGSADFEDRYGNFSDSTSLNVGGALGRRIWDFSYLTFDYGYLAYLSENSGSWQSNGTFEYHKKHNRHVINVNYGWNSEDDFYFPTQGSSFRTGFGWAFGSSAQGNAFHISFRKTWPLANGFVSIQFGETPSSDYRQNLAEDQLLATTYARAIAPGDFVRRGRWYIEAGATPLGYKEEGKRIIELGLKLGVRLETSSLGVIDLYVLGAEEPDR